MVKKTKEDEPVISSLDSKADENFIPSGIKELDEMIGGFYRGRITELWGEPGVGKTHLVTLLMANLSKDNKVLFVDSEFSLNKARVRELGADPANIDYLADSRLERVCEALVTAIGKYDVIVLDSLAALTPLTVDTNEIGENSIGLFSRLIKHWVVKFRPRLGKSKTAFIALNQHRKSLGLYAKQEPPGGMAWQHVCDVRILLATNSADKILNSGTQTAHWVHATVKKNKMGKPFQSTKFKVEY